MKRLRVLILTHEELIPPEEIAALPEKERQRFQKEFDVAQALRGLGHDVQFLGVAHELAPIRQHVEGFRPDIVFNLLMEFQDVAMYQAYVGSYLALIRTAEAGCNPRGLLLARDKALAKTILRAHRVPTPPFHVFPRGRRVHVPKRMRFPQIVKTVDEEASRGISQASIVDDANSLIERVTFVHRKVGCDAIAEDYIAGREITVGVLGNQRLKSFPVWEMMFDKLPAGSEPIATERAKWDPAYQERIGLRTGRAEGLSAELEARIARIAKRVFRVLGLSGYARIDLRLSEAGGLFVLEANPNPDLRHDEDFAASAALIGMPYPKLIQSILNLGLRYRVPELGD